jgi:hypothetical protein
MHTLMATQLWVCAMLSGSGDATLSVPITQRTDNQCQAVI